MTKQNGQTGANHLGLQKSTSLEQSVDEVQAGALTDVESTKEEKPNIERTRALAKSEIMEQLSRARFPWEE
jgi:hypothetical protein